MARITLKSRLHHSARLADDLEGFGEALAEGLKGRLEAAAAQDGGPVPDPRRTLALLRANLLDARQELLARDDEHRKQQQETKKARRARNAAVRRLRRILIGVRGIMDGAGGPGKTRTGASRLSGAFELLGLEGRLAEAPTALLAQSRSLLRCLKDPATAEKLESLGRSPGRPSLNIDPAELAAQVEDLTTALAEAIRNVHRAERQEEATAIERRRAAEALDEHYGPARNYLAALGELAGVPAVAVALRRYGKRRRGSQEKAALLASAGVTEDATTSSEDPPADAPGIDTEAHARRPLRFRLQPVPGS